MTQLLAVSLVVGGQRMQGRPAGLQGDGTAVEKILETAPGAARQSESTAVPPEAVVTEICDEDYRSFCYPCYALEEAPDRK